MKTISQLENDITSLNNTYHLSINNLQEEIENHSLNIYYKENEIKNLCKILDAEIQKIKSMI